MRTSIIWFVMLLGQQFHEHFPRRHKSWMSWVYRIIQYFSNQLGDTVSFLEMFVLSNAFEVDCCLRGYKSDFQPSVSQLNWITIDEARYFVGISFLNRWSLWTSVTFEEIWNLKNRYRMVRRVEWEIAEIIYFNEVHYHYNKYNGNDFWRRF